MSETRPILVFHSTRCLPGARPYGGVHRHRQILHLLSLGGIQPVSLDLFDRSTRGRASNILSGLPLLFSARFPASRTLSTLWSTGRFSRIVRRAIAAHPGCRPLLLWENTSDPLLAHAALGAGLRIIALPHDFVSLNRPSASVSLRSFGQELGLLRRVHSVQTISEEETILLRLVGCEADWLPYFPAPDLEADFHNIRAARCPADDAPLLILGSTVNPQTREGILAQLAQLAATSKPFPRRVLLAGNGTASLHPHIPPGVTLLGPITDAELRKLLPTVVALWVNQYAGTGALTRIPEMLLAGVPVIGSGVALRSARHLASTYQADSMAAIESILPTLPRIATAPFRPTEAEARFVARVTQAAHCIP